MKTIAILSVIAVVVCFATLQRVSRAQVESEIALSYAETSEQKRRLEIVASSTRIAANTLIVISLFLAVVSGTLWRHSYLDSKEKDDEEPNTTA